jgi:hypothetical protein
MSEMDTLQLLMHPVRLRIVHALSGGQTRTTAQLGARMPEVADERRVHGAVERSYRLHRARAIIEPETGASMSLDAHRETFAAATAALVAEFNAYLDRGDAKPFADRVGYRQVSLWLSHEELTRFQEEMGRFILAMRANPAEGRRRYLVSPIVFPLVEPSDENGGTA